MRRVFAALALIVVAVLAVAQEGLDDLVPLLTLYGRNGSSPAFDVAGIRCAGLVAAQDNWARAHGTGAMPQAAMAQVPSNLDAAEQERLNAGQDIVAANTSVQADMYRVIDLYTARFASIIPRVSLLSDVRTLLGMQTRLSGMIFDIVIC